MIRQFLLAVAAVACGCTSGASGSGGGTGSSDADAAVEVTADAGATEATSGDAASGDVAAETAQDAGVTETAADAQLDLAAEVASDAGVADVVADIAKEVADAAAADAADVVKEVADVAPVDVAPVDAGTSDSAADTKAEVAQPKDGQCTTEFNCKNAMMCIAPGESIGCGMCFKPENTCDSDAGCNPPATICKPLKCACSGESTCQPGCKAASDCAEGFFCAPTGKCVEDVCKITDPPGADKSCKPNFVCKNPANPHCFRKECTASTECEGFCVKGLCYSAPGQCSYPPP